QYLHVAFRLTMTRTTFKQYVTLICNFYFIFFRTHLQPRSTLFPYTTLFRSPAASRTTSYRPSAGLGGGPGAGVTPPRRGRDLGEIGRSTRLNSSHVKISYAVFCLKKKSNLYRMFIEKYKERLTSNTRSVRTD